MNNVQIEFTFSNDYHSDFDNYENIYEDIAKVVFNHLNLVGYFIFEVDLVSLDEIHRINKEYRNIDRPTDVISFAFEDDPSYKMIKKTVDIPRDLGEIFISCDVAKRQSEEYEHSLEREMAFLFVHGLLHLLGYDHIEKEDEEIMFKIQNEVMKLLNL